LRGIEGVTGHRQTEQIVQSRGGIRLRAHLPVAAQGLRREMRKAGKGSARVGQGSALCTPAAARMRPSSSANSA